MGSSGSSSRTNNRLRASGWHLGTLLPCWLRSSSCTLARQPIPLTFFFHETSLRTCSHFHSWTHLRFHPSILRNQWTVASYVRVSDDSQVLTLVSPAKALASSLTPWEVLGFLIGLSSPSTLAQSLGLCLPSFPVSTNQFNGLAPSAFSV